MWIRILSACAGLAAAIIAAVVLLVSYDVLARNVGLPSPIWVVDVTEYALPFATLLVAPWLAHRGEHIKIDLVSAIVPASLMGKLERVINLLCGLVSLVVAWYGVSVTHESYTTGALVIKNVVFPEWWVFASLPVCFFILAFEFIRRAFVAHSDSGMLEQLDGQ